MRSYKLIIIGGGVSGLNCAINGFDRGIKDILIIEKDSMLGGTLKSVLESKDYIEELIYKVNSRNIEVQLDTMVLSINDENKVITTSMENGIEEIYGEKIIICNGGKEKGRESINIEGDRCAGIYTVGMAEKLLDNDKVILGKNVLIYGTNNLYRIADKLKKRNIKISAIVCKNLDQEVFDLSNHLLLNYDIKTIHGNGRIEEVSLGNAEIRGIECDTIIIAAGIVPDGIIGMRSNISLNPENGGILVGTDFKTSRDGVYACGDNVIANKSIKDIEGDCKKLVNNFNK